MKRVTFLALSLTVFIAASLLVSVTARAQAFHPMSLSGTVTDFQRADCGKAGSITIAGVKIPIAAGVYVVFTNPGQALGANGVIFPNETLRSELWQVIGSGRTINVYLDSTGRIRLTPGAFGGPTTSRNLNMTGIVNAVSADSITINNLRFAIAAGTTVPATADPNAVVRIAGALNANNELSGTVTVSSTPYQTVTICGAPRNFTVEGPVTGAPLIAFGPNVVLASPEFICDQGFARLAIDGTGGTGSAGIPIAPNFVIPNPVISIHQSACYALTIDQFGWITNSSRELPNTDGAAGRICGTVTTFVAAPPVSYPTALGEAAQRGRIDIGLVRFDIAANQTLTNQNLATVGARVCLTPVFDPSGTTTPLLPGTISPSRAFQLLSGTKVELQP